MGYFRHPAMTVIEIAAPALLAQVAGVKVWPVTGSKFVIRDLVSTLGRDDGLCRSSSYVHCLNSVISVPVPMMYFTEPEASRTAVFDHRMSRRLPSLVTQ